MEKEYFDRLNNDTRGLIQSIEKSCNIEISIKIDSSRLPNETFQRASLACEIDQNSAEILIPSKEHFPDSSVLHELLHIKRILADGIPRIVICDEFDDWSPKQETGLAKLDNALEHFKIVPDELARRPDRREYWRALMDQALSHLQSGALPSHDVRHLALLDWAFLNLVLPDCGLLEKCRVVLQDNSLTELASDYLECVNRLLASKEKLVRATFEYFEISLEGVCLQVIDTRRGTVSESRLCDVHINCCRT